MKNGKTHFRGCLLGGAIGDALGYPVEFSTMDEIEKQFGKGGVRDLAVDETTGKALISDDTQMTTFTVDGMLWADSRAKAKGIYAYVPCVFYSYQKWLYTQSGSFADKNYEFLLGGEILDWEELFARRAPGETSLVALSGSINGKYGSLKNRINNSKGCGAVMRVAPVGMYFYRDPKQAFRIGCEIGAITHGHADAFLSAGLFACLIAEILSGKDLEIAVVDSLEELAGHEGSENVYETVRKAVSLYVDVKEGTLEEYQALTSLGSGCVGEEAIAMAIFCALVHSDDFEKALCLAVNHSGDSDSVGAICGNILGAYLGDLEIPYSWIEKVELADLMMMGADKMLAALSEDC